MSSYRRYVSSHPEALARSVKQVRRHAWEVGPLDTEAFSSRPATGLNSALEDMAKNVMDAVRGIGMRDRTSLALAPAPFLSRAECPNCDHRHVQGEMCTVLFVNGHCGCRL